MGKSYKLDRDDKKGRDNAAFNNSFTNLNDIRPPPENKEERISNGQVHKNGSAIHTSTDEVIEMDSVSEEEKIRSLPKETQDRVRNMNPAMRGAFLAMSPETRTQFKEWPMEKKLKLLSLPPDEVRRLNKMTVKEREDFLSKPKNNSGKTELNGTGPNAEMIKKLQAMPSEMREVFMNMSDKDRQKFIEMRKKAADWPEEKRKKLFQKMYKDYMKKQARDIIKAKR